MSEEEEPEGQTQYNNPEDIESIHEDELSEM